MNDELNNTSPEVQEAKTRYENSKELLERAKRIYDRDLNDFLFTMDRAKNHKLK